MGLAADEGISWICFEEMMDGIMSYDRIGLCDTIPAHRWDYLAAFRLDKEAPILEFSLCRRLPVRSRHAARREPGDDALDN